MHRSLAFVFGVALSIAAGCGGKTAGGGCDGNNDCKAGQVCVEGACITVCGADTDCADTEICVDRTCRAGTRPQPTITAVDGDGTLECAQTPGQHCLHAGLLVQGTNLAGAAFTLIRTNPTGSPTTLTVRDGGSDTAAAVDLPDVPPGDYVLTAANNSGSVDQALQLLQGEPGENFTPTGDQLIDSINGASNQIAVARLPVGATAGTVAAGAHLHAAADISAGVLDVARLPAHPHPTLQPLLHYAVLEERAALNTSPVEAADLTAPDATSWDNVRNLDQEVVDTGDIVAVDAGFRGHFTIQPGTYIVHVRCPAFLADRHKCRLYNTDAATTALVGTLEFSNNGGNYAYSQSEIAGLLTLTAATRFRVEHYTQVGNADAWGLENTMADGEVNTYARLELLKIR